MPGVTRSQQTCAHTIPSESLCCRRPGWPGEMQKTWRSELRRSRGTGQGIQTRGDRERPNQANGERWKEPAQKQYDVILFFLQVIQVTHALSLYLLAMAMSSHVDFCNQRWSSFQHPWNRQPMQTLCVARNRCNSV